MIFGYTKVSTKEQILDSQIDSQESAGCQEIFSEKISGKRILKPPFDLLISKLRIGDVFVADSLDRLGRTSRGLTDLPHYYIEPGIQFKSLKEGMFDITIPIREAI
ncbi:recombinase family protein [Draconibacterium sp. IB214405]|uniref:recombinase family protein n=1 Tax=Draconibacterium sp. IB214405 TaxID=3097352 RepID=UPI002A11772D|nr:recombinase family protein [Draconibacterium sp. IB214405]MDX8341789.1 recombinase family protein [Draconibacterium sp. IB214405]